jgi:hypothetical protein
MDCKRSRPTSEDPKEQTADKRIEPNNIRDLEMS